ncbi:aminopeptidase P family protein [Fusibacter paucivorans]|uniref:Aminopeptidase P family protein n=1 Tax=Fusibacter paucivorans TaxID=76009 RepID=A0ABS5PQQ7_9FIRM|nr:Xaa-Pro peptidase family protein [Fusibacter paucivorans]MBS7527489.1 aminopeptidase P family protein [Fusibacter paucivorans]
MNNLFIDKLCRIMKTRHIDAMLIAPSEELQFLFGFLPFFCERFQGMFIKQNGDYFYFCNLLTRDEVLEILPSDKVYTWYDQVQFTEPLLEVLKDKGLDQGIIAVNTTVRAFNIIEMTKALPIQFVNGRSILEEIRLHKTDEEIQMLKEASKRTDWVMAQIIDAIRPGVTEGELIDLTKASFESQGMTTAFAIIATGPNAALPHYSGRDRTIEARDVVLMDIGGFYKGLCSDITRTVFVGTPTEEMKAIYQIVKSANEAGIEASKNQVKACDVDTAGRHVIEAAGYGNQFITRLGHGIGYANHEGPYINGYNTLPLDNRMCFTIEPGIYLKGRFGVRIEDIVIMENGTPTVITHYPKDILIKD